MLVLPIHGRGIFQCSDIISNLIGSMLHGVPRQILRRKKTNTNELAQHNRPPMPWGGRGIPWGSVHHFKPKRVLTRHHPETNENRHKRFAQHIGSPRRGGSSFSLPVTLLFSFFDSLNNKGFSLFLANSLKPR